jgi:hypothetical protein
MISIRFRLPGARIGILIIVVVTMTLLRLGHSPEVVLMLIAGVLAAAAKAVRYLAPPAQEV